MQNDHDNDSDINYNLIILSYCNDQHDNDDHADGDNADSKNIVRIR